MKVKRKLLFVRLHVTKLHNGFTGKRMSTDLIEVTPKVNLECNMRSESDTSAAFEIVL